MASPDVVPKVDSWAASPDAAPEMDLEVEVDPLDSVALAPSLEI